MVHYLTLREDMAYRQGQEHASGKAVTNREEPPLATRFLFGFLLAFFHLSVREKHKHPRNDEENDDHDFDADEGFFWLIAMIVMTVVIVVILCEISHYLK